MKSILIVLLLSVYIYGNDTNTSKETSFVAMPTVSSNPTAGTGLGVMGMMIYYADENSSPSQAILMGQYTNTDSYNVMAINQMYFDNDRYVSNTIVGTIFNNSEFDIDIPISPPEKSANFDVSIIVAMQQLLYEIKDSIYVGGQMFYIDQTFSPKNNIGAAFLLANGIEDSQRLGIGAIMSYDTRSKKEKIYPRNSEFINVTFNDFPESLGTKEHFYNLGLNARHYQHGFKHDDVLALQLFYQYNSENAPDGALAALGARNVLRGFSVGQYKARKMLATQAEYRYQITGTRYRLALFGGYAKLSGGSKANDLGGSREDDGNYYSGGVGVRYTLKEDTGTDLRIDYAKTNKGDNALYVNFNQAF